MTNITNEQLEAWASLGPWEWNQTGDDDHVENTLISKDAGIVLNASWRPSSCEIQVADPDSEALIAAAPALAAALLAERKAREVEAGELHRALGLAEAAINAAYMQSDAEWRGHDNIAGKHDKIVREGRSAIRQALKGPTP